MPSLGNLQIGNHAIQHSTGCTLVQLVLSCKAAAGRNHKWHYPGRARPPFMPVLYPCRSLVDASVQRHDESRQFTPADVPRTAPDFDEVYKPARSLTSRWSCHPQP